MEVTYTLTAKHYAQFQRFWYRKKARLKVWMRLVLSVMLLVALLCLIALPQLSPWASVLAPALYFAAFFLWLPFLLLLNAPAYAKRVPDFLGLHTMRVGPEGLIGKSGGTETKRQWSIIHEITEDNQMLYFFLGPRFAVILPKDAFPTPAQAQRFADAARFFWQHPGEALPPELTDDGAWPPPPQMLRPG